LLIVRERLAVPPPQEAVHALQPPQDDTTQSTGHGVVPQTPMSVSKGQPNPPWAAGTVIVRCRMRMPPPHELVHLLHSPYSETTQLIGHSCLLQARSSASSGQT
jgi:hypothetical protein